MDARNGARRQQHGLLFVIEAGVAITAAMCGGQWRTQYEVAGFTQLYRCGEGVSRAIRMYVAALSRPKPDRL